MKKLASISTTFLLALALGVTTVQAAEVVTFTTPGSTTWTAPAGVTAVEYLVIAGGGAGGKGGVLGANAGAGGGAGGFTTGTMNVTPGQSYTVTIGAGGSGTWQGRARNGGNSIFDGVIALGGGGGGAHIPAFAEGNTDPPVNSEGGVWGPKGIYTSGGRGGSGGGGLYSSFGGSALRSEQGNKGGNGNTGSGNVSYTAAGGGGAGAAGVTPASTSYNGQAGGAGRSSAISGSSVTYAGGGGSGGYLFFEKVGVAGAGGSGGGGEGGLGCGVTGTNGTPNTGGGGGGGAGVYPNCNQGAIGGNGGSGVVILKTIAGTPVLPTGNFTYDGAALSSKFNYLVPQNFENVIVEIWGGGGGGAGVEANAQGGLGGTTSFGNNSQFYASGGWGSQGNGLSTTFAGTGGSSFGGKTNQQGASGDTTSVNASQWYGKAPGVGGIGAAKLCSGSLSDGSCGNLGAGGDGGHGIKVYTPATLPPGTLVPVVIGAGGSSAGTATPGMQGSIKITVTTSAANTQSTAASTPNITSSLSTNVPSTATTPPASIANLCLDLTSNFGPDDTDSTSNGEVTKLQRFLAQDTSIYPEGLVTGFFGSATTLAVQRLQSAKGIISSGTPASTGYGAIGPRTRAALACATTSSTSAQTSQVAAPTQTTTQTPQSETSQTTSAASTQQTTQTQVVAPPANLTASQRGYSAPGTISFVVPQYSGQLVVELWGAGGGGGSYTVGGNGQATTFGSFVSGGGSGGAVYGSSQKAAGGVATGGDTNTSGNTGNIGAGGIYSVGSPTLAPNMPSPNFPTEVTDPSNPFGPKLKVLSPGTGSTGGYYQCSGTCPNAGTIPGANGWGPSGASGAYVRKVFTPTTLQPGSTVVLTIGDGGAGGTSHNAYTCNTAESNPMAQGPCAAYLQNIIYRVGDKGGAGAALITWSDSAGTSNGSGAVLTGDVSTTLSNWAQPGSYTYQVPAAFDTITVEVWGGGGAGSDGRTTTGSGGRSTFGSMYATGGTGGVVKSAGGTGGQGFSGDINERGNDGGLGESWGYWDEEYHNNGGRPLHSPLLDIYPHMIGTWQLPSAGGAGQNQSFGTTITNNPGGGSGGYAKKVYTPATLTPGSFVSLVVGTGGSGGTPSNQGQNGVVVVKVAGSTTPPPPPTTSTTAPQTPPPASCTQNGVEVAHGASRAFFSDAGVDFGQSCNALAQTRTCTDGNLSGSVTFKFSSCKVGEPNACSFNGQSVAHGAQVEAFQFSSVPFGSSCGAPITRTCNNGNLTGTFVAARCEVEAPAPCTFNNQSIPHNGLVNAFSAASVPSSSTCDSVKQVRQCFNGNLNGSFTNPSCEVQAAVQQTQTTATQAQATTATTPTVETQTTPPSITTTQDTSSTANTTTTVTPPAPTTPTVSLVNLCIDLTSNFGPDDTDSESNGEVTKLQRFLAQDTTIYPEGRVTGFFGPATIKALQRLQAAKGIVTSGDPDSTGFGFIGPKTRRALACTTPSTTPTTTTTTSTGSTPSTGSTGTTAGTGTAVTGTTPPSTGDSALDALIASLFARIASLTADVDKLTNPVHSTPLPPPLEQTTPTTQITTQTQTQTTTPSTTTTQQTQSTTQTTTTTQTTQPATCPTGQTLSGNQCVAITCPTGQTLSGSSCVAITCPTGQALSGNTCLPITCATGQTLSGSSCVAITCPTGQTLSDSSCVAISCPAGQTPSGNSCVAITCVTGQTLQGNSCVAITCPTGQTLSGSSCVAITCPTGQTLSGNTCVAPATCNFNGTTVASGSSVQAWQLSAPSGGVQCISQQRTCQSGSLDGSYQFSNCTPASTGVTASFKSTVQNTGSYKFRVSGTVSGLPSDRSIYPELPIQGSNSLIWYAVGYSTRDGVTTWTTSEVPIDAANKTYPIRILYQSPTGEIITLQNATLNVTGPTSATIALPGASASTPNKNVATALAALEAALRAIMGKLRPYQ